MILIMAILDAVGVFYNALGVVGAYIYPEIVENNFFQFLHDKSKLFGVESVDEFIIFFRCISFYTIILLLYLNL